MQISQTFESVFIKIYFWKILKNWQLLPDNWFLDVKYA